MERDAHYFLVGLFVIVMAVAGFFFAGLFYDKPSTATAVYDIHFDTPVEGLEKGSEVRYMGIKMGEVSEVFLLPDNPVRVGVRIKLEVRTPVNAATVATLRQQGLTGVPFVSLAQDSSLESEPLSVSAGNAFPVIRTKLTDMDAVIQQLPNLEQNLSKLVAAANEVFNTENREHLAGLLKNLHEASAGLPQLIANLNQTSRELKVLVEHLDGAVQRSEQGLAGNMKALQSTLASIKQTSQRVDKLVQDIDRVVVNNEGRVNELLGEGGENLKAVLDESRKAAVSVRQLSERLEQNPSQIIYQPVPQGTELPR
ncbi:phospholipid/cholesterol/gamma-HCH transport system substrate-binding protein [Thiothrix caldifontis]|uniref:Phospholipid/cholesterol/gamma-HCH transport system substrate-binding protein n=1 Tax=Thiothrix caldifontis TaxID=525918 RepID=A0A1H4GIS7_9GAMM|nr:MlaD family protein [Thiothrix caldifontis]SEB09191.1 phospholipid/cholesterol/gamma-HCH transport system substrate-binding protein [Thiothrix caldifontis]